MSGDLPAPRRNGISRDRGTRRLWPAIDARRRLNAQANSTRNDTDPVGRDDPHTAGPTPTQGPKRVDARPEVGASLEVRKNEGEFLREIVRRAKRARERAAESLKRMEHPGPSSE
jgi:hypothetical protein